MELLSLADVQRKMLEQYKMLDGEIPELNMKDASFGPSDIKDLETRIGVFFPKIFSKHFYALNLAN